MTKHFEGVKAVLSKSPKQGKKWRVVVTEGDVKRTIDFGADGYGDFMIFTDESPEEGKRRRERYITRHSAREDWSDPFTAGFWSRWLLWGETTIEESLQPMIDLGMEIEIKSYYLPDRRASERNSR